MKTHETSRSESRPSADPVLLELFTNRFSAIAADMGESLQRTALSTNIRDRLDFSCALLNREGRLVVNAPHIPVHLGALGLCVRRVAAALDLGPGDAAVTNHPAFGGSHLPDVTVVSPVFAPRHPGGPLELLGYTANRAHHAEIGGTRPGSMPPDATRLVEEGVVIPPMHLVRRGEVRWSALRRLLTEAPWPTRAVEENLADLNAALAANQRGGQALARLAALHGFEIVELYMRALEDQATRRLARALEALPDGVRQARETLDDGTPIEVAVTISGDRAHLDFTGTGGIHPGNLNAPPAVVRSAVLYVLRLLLAEPLPLNEGLLVPVQITVPPGILNPPFGGQADNAPAVVGGNVETSQRLVDTLLKAFELVACSQGTMNNLLFGNTTFGYYETLCGGAGAGPGFAGESAVHTHMTNTRITDPEILEARYPVRLERFAIRRGSGGRGRYPGGDGVHREMTFLAPVALSLLSQHRTSGPYGLAGGSAGQPGRQTLIRHNGESVPLDGIARVDIEAGDRLILETPGGGGWGTPDPDTR